MDEFLKIFGNYILTNLPQIWRLFVIPFMSLGLVYTFGRLLPILKTDNSKNFLAFISMIIIAYITGKPFTQDFELFYIIWDSAVYTLLSVIIYINVCWKLYNRFDAFFDKKFGPDNFKPSKKKKSKKKNLFIKIAK